MDIVLTKKQFWITGVVLGVLMFLVSITINMVYLYNKDDITINCINGSEETYLKENLNYIDSVCGGVNIYKYNDNTGLWAYYPNREMVQIAITEYLKYQ